MMYLLIITIVLVALGGLAVYKFRRPVPVVIQPALQLGEITSVLRRPALPELQRGEQVRRGTAVEFSFAGRTLIGNVADVRGRRTRISTFLNGHPHTVRRKLHELRPVLG